jgi:hypothetical protein
MVFTVISWERLFGPSRMALGVRYRRSDITLKGKPETGIYAAGMIHSQVPGLSRQVSGSGIQHQVQVRARTRTRTRTRT